MEGLDTITYWYRSGRFIPGILPLPAQHMASTGFIDALSDLILNSRLPVGLVSLGMHKLKDADSMESCMEGLLRMRRLGVLIHFLDFSGASAQIRWVEEIEPEGLHIEMGQFRAEGLPKEMISIGQKFNAQIYASNITLVKDLENVMAMGAHHCYGGLMMPPISRHQMLHTSDSRIAKAIFSLHPHKNLNGDK
jgi:EAL domain-containing protein (putative c-di-GMP-specific phosphodiesterase class I)